MRSQNVTSRKEKQKTMKKLSELSIADLVAIELHLRNKLDDEDLSVEESFYEMEKLDLLDTEISKRLGEIDFNN